MNYQSYTILNKTFYTIGYPFRIVTLLLTYSMLLEHRFTKVFNSLAVLCPPPSHKKRGGRFSSQTGGELKNYKNILTNRHSIVILLLLAFSQNFAQTRPTSIPGLQLWLRADSNVVLNGSTVSTWKDCSGNGNDVSQITVRSQPIFTSNVLNGKSVIRFDGIDDYFNGGNTVWDIGTSGSTIFIIGKCTSGAGYYIAKSKNGSTPNGHALGYSIFFYNFYNNDWNGGTRSPGSYEQISVVWDRGTLSNKLYANGSILNTWALNSGNPTNNYDFLVGGYSNGTGFGAPLDGTYLTGDIAEIIIYNRPLNNFERKQVENYLMKKYSQTVELGSDITIKKTICDTTIRAQSGFASYKWNTGETSESIKAKKGIYSITVTDANGFSSSDSINVSYAQIKLTDTVFCSGSNVVLNPQTPNTYSLKWSTGEITKSISVSTAKKYWVSVNDNSGCSAVSEIITVVEDTLSKFISLGSDTSLCKGNLIGLKNKIVPVGIKYLWSTTETSPLIAVPISMNYKVTVTDKNNCVAIDMQYVTVTGIAPTASFSVGTGCAGSKVPFTNTSNSTTDNWQWNFGDNTTDFSNNPSHNYAKGGTYSVTATFGNGTCKNSISKQITINAKPDEPFILSPNNNYIESKKTETFTWKCSNNTLSRKIELATDPLFNSIIFTKDQLLVDSFQYTFQNNNTVLYWKVTAKNSCGEVLSTIQKLTFFNETSIPNMQLWLRADSNVVYDVNKHVSLWNDCSGNGNNVKQTNILLQPKVFLKTLNNNSVIRFDGVDDYFNGGNTKFGIGGLGATIFILGKCLSSTGYYIAKSKNGVTPASFGLGYTKIFFDFYNNAWNATTRAPGSYEQISVVWDRGTLSNKLYANGSILNTWALNSGDPTNNYDFLIGGYSNGTGFGAPLDGTYLTGDIAEIIIYNRPLNNIERKQVENYLVKKYSQIVDLGSDITINDSLCATTLHAGLGFDSYLWSNGEKTETIKAKKGSYSVTVIDANGFSSSDTITVSYTGTKLAPYASNLCKNEFYTLQTELQPTGYTYLWNTKAITQSIKISTSGNYFATVTDGKGCSQMTDTAIVSIDSFNTTASLGNDTSLCTGNKIGLQKPYPLPTGIQYRWSAGQTTATIPVTGTGKYSVTVSNGNGCKAIDTIAITSKGTAPSVSFTNQTMNGNLLSIQFINTSTPSGLPCLWDFGDGFTSKEQTVVHTFKEGGRFNVTLTVTDGPCSERLLKKMFIPPFNMTGLQLWVQADSNVVLNGKTVSMWKDCSDNKDTLLQPTAENQPTLVPNVLNGHAVLRFDGKNDYLNGGNICNMSTKGITIFVVGKSNQSTGIYLAKSFYGGKAGRYSLNYNNNEFTYLFDDNGTTPQSVTYPKVHGMYDIASAITNGATITNSLYLNGKFLSSSNFNTLSKMNTTFSFLVGAYNDDIGGKEPKLNIPGLFLDGDIAEIIIFNRPLNNTERIQIENYLKTKYAPKPVDLGPDTVITKSLCGTIIHAGTRFKSFQWNTNRNDTLESVKISKTGKYMVDVVDSVFGFPSTSSVKVTFNSEPKLIPDTALCPSSSLTWDTKLNPDDFHFHWNTGETSASITIAKAGKYVLTVTDKGNCSYISDTTTIVIDDFYKSIDLGKDTSLCQYNEIALQKGNDRCVSYRWGDNSTNQAFTVMTAGKYYLTATDKYSCKANDSITISKITGIAPDTKFTVTGHCEGKNITFTDNSVSRNTSSINAWKWFIQKDTLSNQNINYLFSKPGTFYIKQVVQTTGSCSGSKTVPITIDASPKASFSPISVCQFVRNEFINTSSIVSTDSIISFKWVIRDSTILNKDTISYAFPKAGTVKFGLYTTSSKNCIDSAVQQVEIKSSPKAIISNSPSCNGHEYYLFDNSILPLSNSLIFRLWNVNKNDQGDNQSFVYSPLDTTRKFDEVQLIIKSVNGCIDTAHKTIPNSPVPLAALTIKNACVGDSVLFKDKTTIKTGKIVKWKWSIGNSYESFKQNPTLVFKESKTYPVQLKVWSDFGCEDTVKGSIKTIVKPIANFDYNPKIVGAPVDITFTNTSDSASRYLWRFGDTDTSNDVEPVHEYRDSGNYIITLVAYNDLSCTDTTSQKISLSRSNYKLLLDRVFTNEKNGYVSVSTIFINAGINPISKIDFILTKDDGTWVKETWKGLLSTGVVDTFTFASQFRELNGMIPKYICVDANALNKQDTIVSTANKCLTNIDNLTSFTVYPIPTQNSLTITFATPQKGTVEFEILDSQGKLVLQGTKDAVEGFNALPISTTDLSQGYYLWKITIGGNSKTGAFVISKP